MIIIMAGIAGIFFTSLVAGWKGFFISAGIVLVLALIPFEGFKTFECINTIELIKLRRNDGKRYFIQRKGRKVIYAYDNREQYGLYGEVYEQKKIRGNIKIYESEECDRPLLKIFKSSPSRELLALALIPSRKKYIFYVPMGTIVSRKTSKISCATEDIPRVL